METKKAIESKTIWVSLGLTILGALEAFDWVQIVPQEYTGIVIAGIGIVMMLLRKATKTSI